MAQLTVNDPLPNYSTVVNHISDHTQQKSSLCFLEILTWLNWRPTIVKRPLFPLHTCSSLLLAYLNKNQMTCLICLYWEEFSSPHNTNILNDHQGQVWWFNPCELWYDAVRIWNIECDWRLNNSLRLKKIFLLFLLQ